jgi:subtilase family serine protease
MLRFARVSLALLELTFGLQLLGSAQVLTHPKSEGLISHPSWATADRFRGRVDGATPITIQVHLNLRDLSGAQAELEAVSDPGSPRYGHYLTSEEFESKYSPTAEDLSTVRSHLEAEGFSITYVPRNRLFLSARAKAADVERVFATRLGLFELDQGELRRAPIEPAQVPAAIASRISGVLGLSTTRARPGGSLGKARTASSSNTSLPTCSNYFGEYFDTVDPPYGAGYPNPTPIIPCGLTPSGVRRAYGLANAVAGGNDGRGVKIAIVDAWLDPTLVADAQAYAAQFDPAHPLATSQITLIDAPSGGDPTIPVDFSWYYEQVFDVEAVHAIAPGAHIVFVGAATSGNEDLVAALNFIVQDNLASIVSNSYTTDIETASDSNAALLDAILIQGGLKGIGMYFGSGDCGDEQVGSSCLAPGGGYGTLAVNSPASSPFATAVGGTSLYLNQDGSRAYETGWESGESVPAGAGANTTWTPPPPGLLVFGAGGGRSHLYSQPKYQKLVVPAALAGSPAARVVPDVAMLGDFDSGITYALTDPYTLTYTVFQNGGGTSLAVQLFAATVALAEQRAGHRIGFANPKFYRNAHKAFNDIVPTPTPQSIVSPGAWQDTEDPPGLQVLRPDGTIVPHTLHTAPGFDNVTGLGVPAGERFLEAVSED